MRLQEALDCSTTGYAMMILHKDCAIIVSREEEAWLFGEAVALMNRRGSPVERTTWPKSYKNVHKWVPLRCGRIFDELIFALRSNYNGRMYRLNLRKDIRIGEL